jgi:hypothetical protein
MSGSSEFNARPVHAYESPDKIFSRSMGCALSELYMEQGLNMRVGVNRCWTQGVSSEDFRTIPRVPSSLTADKRIPAVARV